MKRNHYLKGTLATSLVATLCAFTPGLPAQSGQEAQPPAQQQPNQQAPDQQQPNQAQPSEPQPDQQQNKTFEGKIMKLQDGKFALVTGQTAQGQMAGHFLDDQDIASKYEGKQVKVTGTLEEASNTIHVTKIEAAA
jgi:hypothetical protein